MAQRNIVGDLSSENGAWSSRGGTASLSVSTSVTSTRSRRCRCIPASRGCSRTARRGSRCSPGSNTRYRTCTCCSCILLARTRKDWTAESSARLLAGRAVLALTGGRIEHLVCRARRVTLTVAARASRSDTRSRRSKCDTGPSTHDWPWRTAAGAAKQVSPCEQQCPSQHTPPRAQKSPLPQHVSSFGRQQVTATS